MGMILVMSDSHGNQVYIRKACEHEVFDMLFHLGDEYHDLTENQDLLEQKEVLRVPGNMDLPDPMISSVQRVTVDAWNIVLIHQLHQYIPAENDHVVLYGHTHQPHFHEEGGIFFANPGHLKSDFHRNSHASYLTMNCHKEYIDFTWKQLDGSVFQEFRLNRNASSHWEES